MANVFYNRSLRKYVIGFGNLFNDITLVRYNPDLTEAQRMIVPIVYAPKEDYVMRLEEDPELGKKVQLTLPRMSFELNGFNYDSTRKLNTNTKNFAQTGTGLVSQYNPVPYNFDFNLYLYVRNIEDGTQIIEHILSYFTPDYTMKLNMIPEMGIIKEVPVVLNSTSQDVDFEGNYERDTRTIIWTLNFTVKGYIYGKINESGTGLITHSITSIYNKPDDDEVISFQIDPTSGLGTYQIGETVYQGYSGPTAVATGKVVSFNNNILHLQNINGNFVSNLPIKATSSTANYNFTSYNPTPQKLVQIDVIPSPNTAGPTDQYTYDITITEGDSLSNVSPIIIPENVTVDCESGSGFQYLDLN